MATSRVPPFKNEARRVRGLTTFSAPDPWNDNQQGSFRLDEYEIEPPQSNPLSSAALALRGRPLVCALQSDLDSGPHFVPQSLSELWKSKHVPDAALPQLAWSFPQPLNQWDFILVRATDAFSRLIWLTRAPWLIFLAVLVARNLFTDRPAWTTAESAWLAATLFCLAAGEILYLSLRRRLRAQTSWVLQACSALRERERTTERNHYKLGHAHAAAGRLAAALKEYRQALSFELRAVPELDDASLRSDVEQQKRDLERAVHFLRGLNTASSGVAKDEVEAVLELAADRQKALDEIIATLAAADEYRGKQR
jgi:hypothetical protein